MRVCLIYSSALHYREGIFRLLDSEMQCDYVFGDSQHGIRQMDTSLLRGNVTIVHALEWRGWNWQPRVVAKLWGGYDAYILLGDTRGLATWLFGLLARIVCPRKRVFFWSHGWYGKESSLERMVKRLFYRLPSGGTFLYGDYARRLMLAEGFCPDRLFVIHNSLDYDRQVALRPQQQGEKEYFQHFGNRCPNLVFVGRLTPVKRLDLLLEAVAICRKDELDLNLTLIGDGEQEEALRRQAAELGLEKATWFYGACYDEAVNARLIAEADLCVSPGNVGLTAIHSMTYGTPVITHDDFPHQMPEFEAIREGVTGGFFHAGDVHSLASAIQTWLAKHGGQRDEVRQACYREIDAGWTPQFQMNVIRKALLTK
ncbi:MAG: glycosyltransferase [Bacteroidaceae bacterium]|nr:glycosyltransferase [Bacteroidaceae bacterium]